MKLAAVHSDRYGRGQERLGGGTDLEDGLSVDRRADLTAHAKSLAVDQFVAGKNSDSDTGFGQAAIISYHDDGSRTALTTSRIASITSLGCWIWI